MAERASGPLADGLTILDGSVLLGGVFDYGAGGGWFAVLRIDDDPRRLLDAYRGQLESVLGVPVRPASDTGCGPAPQPFDLLCRSGAATSARWIGLRVLSREDEGAAYLSIEWLNTPTDPPQELDLAPLPEGGAAPITDQPLAESISPGLVLWIVEGSRLLGDPLPEDGVGYRAVLQVTGDPAAVMRGYAAQLRDGATRLFGDDRMIFASLDQAGGAHITIRVTSGESPALLVSYGYD